MNPLISAVPCNCPFVQLNTIAFELESVTFWDTFAFVIATGLV